MKKITLLLGAAMVTGIALAQNGKENIDKLCGCFEVSFKYVETFAPEKDYKFHERDKDILGVTELALPLVNTDKKVVIQHLLVMGNGGIVKHWREDWAYENPVQWNYIGNKTWEKKTLSKADVKGKWSQSVWEVTDAPRYQGSAPWQVVNGHTIWENTADAPLPRREYTQRKDYNILNRTNRLVITNTGYDHVQDNKKVIRTEEGDKTLVEEKGLNRYEIQDKTNCTAGEKYWEEHKGFWLALEQEWQKIMESKNRIELIEQVDGKDLMTRLFAMADEWKEKKITAANVNTKIKEVLTQHVQ